MPLLDKNAQRITPELSEKINSYILENGVKVSFIAKKMGISNTQMSQIRSGYRKINSREQKILDKILGAE